MVDGAFGRNTGGVSQRAGQAHRTLRRHELGTGGERRESGVRRLRQRTQHSHAKRQHPRKIYAALDSQRNLPHRHFHDQLHRLGDGRRRQRADPPPPHLPHPQRRHRH